MIDNFGPYSYSSSSAQSDRPANSGAEKIEATVISAKFSERNILTVHMVADGLLSDCWSKGCEFARNFNASHIEIEHLLLGASHVRNAEAALSAACDDVEELTHQLGRLCARRSFAQAPSENAAYEASQALRILLCEAAALAVRKNVPNLTLGLVMEALAETEPRPAVLEVLPKLQRQVSEKRAEMVAQAESMQLLHDRMENLGRLLSGDMIPRLEALGVHAQDLNNTIAHAVVERLINTEAGLRQGVVSLMEGLARSAHQNSEELNRLMNLIANPPQYDAADPTAHVGQRTLKIPTTEQVFDAVRLVQESVQIEGGGATRRSPNRRRFLFW
ncbi:MAG: hypothetical protein WBP94_20445 [Rhodomicrobiaceae bacterium]